MSMFSAMYADLANRQRLAWLRDLIAAREKEDWSLVSELISRMRRETFEE